MDLRNSLFFLDTMIRFLSWLIMADELVISLWVFRGIYNGYVFSSYICVVSWVFDDIDVHSFIRVESLFSAMYEFLFLKSVRPGQRFFKNACKVHAVKKCQGKASPTLFPVFFRKKEKKERKIVKMEQKTTCYKSNGKVYFYS